MSIKLKFFPESGDVFCLVILSSPALANICKQSNVLQAGVIPALICFDEVGGDKKSKIEKGSVNFPYFS